MMGIEPCTIRYENLTSPPCIVGMYPLELAGTILLIIIAVFVTLAFIKSKKEATE